VCFATEWGKGERAEKRNSEEGLKDQGCKGSLGFSQENCQTTPLDATKKNTLEKCDTFNLMGRGYTERQLAMLHLKHFRAVLSAELAVKTIRRNRSLIQGSRGVAERELGLESEWHFLTDPSQDPSSCGAC